MIHHLDGLLKEGYQVVVFCRYVATAHYVADHLGRHFPAGTVESVTGEYTPDERRERVEALAEADRRILVATDCLSEGVNLQHLFTAVVHYDLAWNPTRHEQREGRVDRFGQQAAEVRCTMLYGQDNPVDGFVLNVILRKGEAIQKELGVLVPMPEDELRINQALVKAALMKRGESRPSAPQLVFDFRESEQILAPCKLSGAMPWTRPRPTAPSLPNAAFVPTKSCRNGTSSNRRWAAQPMSNASSIAPAPASMPRWSRPATSASAFCPSTCRRPCASA